MRALPRLAVWTPFLLLASAGAAHAQQCIRYTDFGRLPHANLYLENNTAGWVTVGETSAGLIKSPAARIPPFRRHTFRHALRAGRYTVVAEMTYAGRNYRRSYVVTVYNNARTCSQVVRMILTNASFTGVVLPDRRPDPVHYYVWYMPREFTCCRDPRTGQTPHPIRYGPRSRMPAGARVLGGPFGDEGNMRAFMCRHNVRKAQAWIQNYAYVGGVLVSNLPCTAS